MYIIPTFFNVGYSKYMPGTLGAFLALILGIPIVVLYGRILLLLITVVFSIFYFISVPKFLAFVQKKDPEYIVADEVIAEWIIMLFLPESTLIYFSMGFIFFRIFDILKPYPINILDQKSLSGSYFKQAFYILADDLLAALYTVICIWFMHLIFYSTHI